MTRSTRHIDRYPDIRASLDILAERQKAAMEAHDKAIRRYELKERLCKLAYLGCWVAIGLFIAYCLYQRGG